MRSMVRLAVCAPAAILLWTHYAAASSAPRLSFEELTDKSDVIVTGNVTRSWAAWDASHKYIWTHYEVAVSAAYKGAPGATLEIAEPGGTVGDRGMTIAGSVSYSPGENVVIFAARMPNGYLRTSGWSQGRYGLDRSGVLHGEPVQEEAATGSAVRTLDGMSVRELGARVTARVRAHAQSLEKVH